MNNKLDFDEVFERFMEARANTRLPTELIDFAVKKEKELKSKGDIDIDIASKYIGFYIGYDLSKDLK